MPFPVAGEGFFICRDGKLSLFNLLGDLDEILIQQSRARRIGTSWRHLFLLPEGEKSAAAG
ncbi:hypothetical protein DXM27_00325 [Rhizobium rhizogenes]|uniref:Uncharacterized protein n=1 Tax=Rhizobium rhizogenes TaxID=359 RepID=A0AA88F7A3_RHIRH|nr:hypothetical protein DXM27_00325 [Rhizobium rhizogenes]